MKNSLACVIFKEKKINNIFNHFEAAWRVGKLLKDILPESTGCSIVLKANYFWFQNILKQLIKSLEEIHM